MLTGRQAERGRRDAPTTNSDGQVRLRGVDRYHAGQTNESAGSRQVDQVQGGGKSSQSNRNRQRDSSWRKTILKILIFILCMCASTCGYETRNNAKQTDIRTEDYRKVYGQAPTQPGRFLAQVSDQWSRNRPLRTHMRLSPEMLRFFPQPLFQDQNNVEADMVISGWSSVSRSEGGIIVESPMLRRLHGSRLSLGKGNRVLECARELYIFSSHQYLKRETSSELVPSFAV